MTDWTNPSLSQTWSNRDLAIKGRDESNAKMNYSADSNIPDETIRWSATNNRFEIWDATGASWGPLSSSFAMSVTQLNGQDPDFYDDTPNGTRMLFYQSSAPTGWTQDASVNDRVLRVVSTNGGGSGGSWTISGVTVDNHTLTVSEMPSHNHGGNTGTDGNHNHTASTGSGGNHRHSFTMHAGGDQGGTRPQGSPNNATNTHYTSYNGTHTHSVTINSNGNHNHTISSQGGGAGHNHGVTADGSWRPSYIDVIACTRSK